VKWDAEIKAFAADCFDDNVPLYECIAKLCRKIYTGFRFVPDFTTVNTPVKEVLAARKGVCQDFSHLAIACIRSFGFAARYVSGYLETLPPPGRPKLQGSDASHAWISVFIPDYGWCDFDPTNDVVPGERHIVTAWGRDYSDVPPLKGIIFSYGKHTLSVEVDVIPI
jgi:transglutaminase-like putative cysteine protease